MRQIKTCSSKGKMSVSIARDCQYSDRPGVVQRLLRINSTEGAVGVAAVMVELRRTGGGGGGTFDDLRSPVLATDDIDDADDGTPPPETTLPLHLVTQHPPPLHTSFPYSLLFLSPTSLQQHPHSTQFARSTVSCYITLLYIHNRQKICLHSVVINQEI